MFPLDDVTMSVLSGASNVKAYPSNWTPALLCFAVFETKAF